MELCRKQNQWEGFPIVEPLQTRHTMETLAFLAKRPLHTVGMAGFILQNGIESHCNRGEFYGCRNALGQLEGIALIGHSTLFEARTDQALAALAKFAQDHRSTYLMMAERDKVKRFWSYFVGEKEEEPRLVCNMVLMQQQLPAKDFGSVPELRVAELSDLEPMVKVNAAIIEEVHGVNPLAIDSEGFYKRCRRRIEQGNSWVLMKNGHLIFKADVAAATPEATYIEGIHVSQEERNRGYGLSCMSQLAKSLEQRTKTLCGLVLADDSRAQAFYRRAGYEVCAEYSTYFLREKAD